MKFTKWIPVVLLLCGQLPVYAEEYEAPIILKVADLLPAETLSSDLYQIHDKVHNDGFLNRYTVTSQWGEWEINSDALLNIRLTEIVAMSEMRKIEEGESFEGAVKDDATNVGEGVSSMINDPKGAMEGTVSGVRKMFELTGESWKSRHTREDESSLTNLGNTLSGFSKAKREYAAKFGVDPYSSNKDLHVELDRIARAASGGVMIGMVAKALIPGGIGVLLSATDLSHSLNELLTTSSEVELRIINREKLQKIGMDAVLIEQFLDDGSTSSTYKTYVVGALETMEGVSGRDLFVDYAIGPPSEDVALFRAQSALMYAGYHAKRQKLDHFARSGGTIAGIDSNKILVVQASLDHILWTEPITFAVEALDEKIATAEKTKGKLLSLSGTASDRTVAELDKRGWQVRQKVLHE